MGNYTSQKSQPKNNQTQKFKSKNEEKKAETTWVQPAPAPARPTNPSESGNQWRNFRGGRQERRELPPKTDDDVYENEFEDEFIDDFEEETKPATKSKPFENKAAAKPFGRPAATKPFGQPATTKPVVQPTTTKPLA